jgi:hypothetical protein
LRISRIQNESRAGAEGRETPVCGAAPIIGLGRWELLPDRGGFP